MKKKTQPVEEPVVAKEILERAKKAADTDKLRPVAKCSVCGGESSAALGMPNAGEQLCWVCRRLKISAWRDSDIQMNAQE
ncbi:MAG: hypothetical protein U0Q16_31520 [Bryobacteraceae bacterium]